MGKIARDSSLAKQLFGYAILGFALTEAIALFALMMAFLISFIFRSVIFRGVGFSYHRKRDTEAHQPTTCWFGGERRVGMGLLSLVYFPKSHPYYNAHRRYGFNQPTISFLA